MRLSNIFSFRNGRLKKHQMKTYRTIPDTCTHSCIPAKKESLTGEGDALRHLHH